mgnify:CR=1 FL=1
MKNYNTRNIYSIVCVWYHTLINFIVGAGYHTLINFI